MYFTENRDMNWLQKHAVEVLIALMVTLLVSSNGLILNLTSRASEVETRVSVIETNVGHINEAVNNVGMGEQSLKEAVNDIKLDVEIIKRELPGFSNVE